MEPITDTAICYCQPLAKDENPIKEIEIKNYSAKDILADVAMYAGSTAILGGLTTYFLGKTVALGMAASSPLVLGVSLASAVLSKY